MVLGVIGSNIIIIFFFYIKGADVTSMFCRHICPLTWAILLHMANPIAAMALNAGSASHRSNRQGTFGKNLQRIFT
jgi:hypothetical protein